MKKGFFVLLALGNLAHAGSPVWIFSPNGSPVVSVSDTGTATVSYTVTNNSKKAHQLVLSSNTPTGITQSGGACVLAGLGSTCTLTLNINGSALPSDNVSGGPILCQTNGNGSPNPTQCYQPSPTDVLVITRTNAPGATTLSASVNQLALSVTGRTEYGLNPGGQAPSSGVSRYITITNTGANPASGLSVLATGLPTGTDNTTTCTETLAPQATCTVTITPGASATSDCNTSHSEPTPGTITVSASNVATSVSTDVVVLDYSCQYQGGYVYAFDDTTPNNGSIGGKVAATSDQAAAYPNGVIWSSNGGTGGGSSGSDNVDTSYDMIPGIDQSSTSSSGTPTFTTSASFFLSTYTNENPFSASSFSMCNGALDGSCNTNNIVTFYNQFVTHNTLANSGTAPFTATSGPTNITYYAAGLCKQTLAGYSDWYLPAICEMGYGAAYGVSTCGSLTTPTLQNMQKSLIDISGLSAPAGDYWSSTEYSVGPESRAWLEQFSSISSAQGHAHKYFQPGVRCSRALTP